jgi:PAS domain S-box-containing protein
VPSWREFSGLTYEEAKGLGWTKALHPDDRERTLKAWNEAVATKSTYEVEYRMRRHDGVYRDLLARGFPVRNEDGSIREWIGTCTDITERKRVEAERAALDEQLRQAQKMESVGQLAGGVAHDFNNILTGISGYTELALERLDTASPMREDLAEVLRLAKRAAELTRQLLAFSRRQTLQPQVLNINDMIADTAKMLKRVLSEDIDLHFAPAPDLGNVRADPMQMEQVLMNLAINARDAMPAGGKLTIETANVELDEDYADHHVSVIPGRYVMMAVSDTGHGMDAATRSRLFEPFFTTKEKSKGTGLGLATAYGIVKQHGGNIWVYTEPGNGATFKIYLPRVEEAASATEPAAEPNVQRGEETILVVEDEPAVRAVAERALKARGYALLTASSAEEAEGLFSEHSERISLLLTDVVLPGINGPRLYDRLRIANPGLKVLYMSGHTGNATVHQGVLDAGVAFMQKPFTLEMIARKVRQVLDS